MEQGSTSRTLAYILVILAFFGVVFILDTFLGVHYAPEEHRLDRPKEPQKEASHQIQQAGLASSQLNNKTAFKEDVNPEIVNKAEKVEKPLIESAGNEEPFFKELKSRYQKNVLSKLPPRKSRTDITIRYYRHPPDGNSAYSLQKLGFYIHERPVDPSYEDFQSNAIYYGDSVRIEDIQLVAYTLLKEGLPLKVIAPSRFGNTWKAHAIEIGADSTLVNRPTLSLAEVQQLSL